MGDEWDSKTVIGFKRQSAKVTRKDSDLNGARRKGAVVATDKKITAGGNKAHQGTDYQRIAKLDRDNEVAPPAKIPLEVGRAMQTARMELKLSQKELAQKINEKPSVLQDYEASKATPSPQILGKLERVLGIRLRGTKVGERLTPKGKEPDEQKPKGKGKKPEGQEEGQEVEGGGKAETGRAEKS